MAPTYADGERIVLSEKELGAVELFPQAVMHNANGRFVAVCGDNEFVIYTAQALRTKSFGSALDCVWSSGGVGDYAVREAPTRVKVFRNFKETAAFKPPVSAEGLSGGALLGVRSADTVCFYEWDTARMVRRIEVAARSVTWNDSGELVAIASDDAFFVLRFSKEAAAAGFAGDPASIGEEGIEAAFELQHEVSDKVRGGVWVGDCFVYTNSANRLNYYVGGEVMTLAHLDRRMYDLGYLAKEGRVYLMDKAGTVVSYALCLAVLEYQTAVVRRDFTAANRILPEIPRAHLNAIAKFLEGQGFKEQALNVADDPDVKFDLALQVRHNPGGGSGGKGCVRSSILPPSPLLPYSSASSTRRRTCCALQARLRRRQAATLAAAGATAATFRPSGSSCWTSRWLRPTWASRRSARWLQTTSARCCCSTARRGTARGSRGWAPSPCSSSHT